MSLTKRQTSTDDNPESGGRRAVAPSGATAPEPVVPAEIRELLGPPPLTSYEDQAAYERLLTQLALALSPADVIEWTWIWELASLAWDSHRARRAIAVCLGLARKRAIYAILQAHGAQGRPELDLEAMFSADPLWAQAEAIVKGDPQSLAAFAGVLEQLGLPPSAVEDAAYLEARETIERLQGAVDRANVRRDAVLREIERRRSALAARARQAVEAVEGAAEAEFE